MKKNIYYALAVALATVSASAQSPTPKWEFRDGGFEACTPNGTPPDSGAWKTAWLGEASGLVTTTAGRTGRAGLWAYTGKSAQDSWSGIFQELPSAPGQVFTATGYVRTPAHQPWVKGSKAQVAVEFVDVSGTALARISSEPLTSPATEWQRHALTTSPAPAGTAKVRLVCYLEKPNEPGISVANFDDCSLAEAAKAGGSEAPKTKP